MAKKICKIRNDKFHWVLEVDGHTILFENWSSADYFQELYTKLGYTVKRDNHAYKED